MHPSKQSTLTGRVALVTGASAGIGRAYCEYLARAGATVVALARRRERLVRLRDELAAAGDARVVPLVCDLSDGDACDVIKSALDREKLEIDVLVNNAGYGVPGRFLEASWPVHADFAEVMTAIPARLCYELLPTMLRRGSGSILNIASVAGFLPGTAGHTQYAAAKAWLIRFSESLAFEYAGSGIRVCAVCPGFTYSEFHDVTGTRELVAALPAWLWMEAEAVVAGSFAALERGDIVYIPGFVNRIIVGAAALLPRRLRYALVRREARRFRNT